MIGKTISHYEIVEKIGEGGRGVVYKARDIRLDRVVALKFLAPQLVENEDSRQRLLQEARAAAALDHPSICTIHEIVEANGQTFLTMAYLEGQTVEQKVREGLLNLDEALDIAIQVADGLYSAHERDIVHRDIKSANIMLTGSPSAPGQVKIIDFGLARLADSTKVTQTAAILGTPAYMSPEQAQRLPVDHRTDIWSLGVVLYEVVTGHLPFEGDRVEAVLYSIIHEDPRPISSLRSGVPRDLDRIVAMAMAKSPEQRYANASDLLADLRALRTKLEPETGTWPNASKERAQARDTVCFGPFEANLHTGELRKHGLKIRIQDLPFRLLALLLERPGELVSREEIREKLWSADTFVEFEHSLNTAASKLRTALGDSAEKSRYIETLPRRGYRFIGKLEEGVAPAPAGPPEMGARPEAPVQHITETQPASGPAELERVVNRCLRKDPARRFQHMDDVKVALEEVKEESDSRQLAAGSGESGRRRQWVGVIAVAIALAAAGWLWVDRAGSPASDIPLTAIPLTSYPGIEWEPSFSPDGNEVAFTWNGEQQENFDIYRQLIAAGEPLRLTTDPAADYAPAWSPDGGYIAFVRSVSEDKSAVILTPALGGSQRRVLEIDGFPEFRALTMFGRVLTWSPDGKWLVIPGRAAPDEPFSLFLHSIESDETRQITWCTARGDYSPAFSPDGQTLAFSRLDVAADLYLVPFSSDLPTRREPTRLTSGAAWQDAPTWISAGRDIVFCAGTSLDTSLWRIAAREGSAPRRLAGVGEGGITPVVSRSRDRLAYARLSAESNVWRLELPPAGTGSPEAVKLIASTREDAEAEYSPDGTRIAFVSDRSGSREIWVCSSEGHQPTPLTSAASRAELPGWSPDGEYLAFASNVGLQWDIYVVSSRGGALRQLTSAAASDRRPVWSRDGMWIYFASDRSGSFQVWKTPSGDSGSVRSAVQVTRQGGNFPEASPDGKFVYFLRGTSPFSLWRIPVAGGEETLVLDSQVVDHNYAVAEQGIYFIGDRETAAGIALRFFSLAAGKVRSILSIEKHAYGISASADGRRLLFNQLDRFESDLMLVENFR